MYINDVHKSLSHASIALSADDAVLSFSSSSLEDLQFKLNLDLKNVAHWLEKNKPHLNTLKSKFMLMTDSKKLKDTCHFRVTVNDRVLERETTFTYLGTVFNVKLSWADQIEFVRKKVDQRLGAFCVGLNIFFPSTLVIFLY